MQTSRRLSDDSARNPRGPVGDVVRRFAAHRSDLELLPWVILAGAVGNFLGFQAWFLVGRRFGRPLLERRPHWARWIANLQDWLGRYETTMSISRSASWRAWIASAPWRSGCPKFSVQRCTVLNALGALLWAATLAVAGYLLGNLLELALENRRRSPRLC